MEDLASQLEERESEVEAAQAKLVEAKAEAKERAEEVGALRHKVAEAERGEWQQSRGVV